ECGPGSQHELPCAVEATDNVAADEIGVVGSQCGRRPAGAGDHTSPETRCEPLDLIGYGLSRVARVGVRNVDVGVDRVDVAGRPGSAKYCCPTRTNGRAGIPPRWVVRSAAATCSKVPPRCTVPARRQSSYFQGTPPCTAKSTLNAAGPCRQRR